MEVVIALVVALAAYFILSRTRLPGSSLKPCHDCGTPVSTRAAACPKCGRSNQPNFRVMNVIGCLVAITLFVVLSLVLLSTASRF